MRKSNQRRAMTMKIQHSQDSKNFKTRKNNHMWSPIAKNIALCQDDKENIHPNICLHRTQSKGGECSKMGVFAQAPSRAHETHKAVHGQEDRDRLFQTLKHQLLNARGQRNQQTSLKDTQSSKKVKQTSREKDHQGKQKPPSYYKQTMRQQITRCSKHAGCQTRKQGQPAPQSQLPEWASDADKCPLDHPKQTPKTAYLAAGCSCEGGWACSQEARNVQKRASESISSGNPSNRPRTPCISQLRKNLKKLCEMSKHLQLKKQSISSVKKHFRQMCIRSFNCQRSYYNEIMLIISKSFHETEKSIISCFNQGRESIEREQQHNLHLTQMVCEEIQKLSICLKNGDKLEYRNNEQLRDTNSHFCGNQGTLSWSQSCKAQIQLPMIQVVLPDWDVSVNTFAEYFHSRFAIKVIAGNCGDQPIQKNQMSGVQSDSQYLHTANQTDQLVINHQLCQPGPSALKESTETQIQQSRECSRLHSHSVFQKAKKGEQIFLFCEEQLEAPDSGKMTNFSFDRSQEARNQIHSSSCILELVEEEDAISPVFKQI